MQRRTLMKAALTAVTLTALQATTALAENTVLKIGFVGVTSGPAAAWGISNQRSMEARASWINETGGYTIGGTTYDSPTRTVTETGALLLCVCVCVCTRV